MHALEQFRDKQFMNKYSSLFIKIDNEKTSIVFIYIDGVIVTLSDINRKDQVKCFLKSSFEIKDLGILKYFLRNRTCLLPREVGSIPKKICILLRYCICCNYMQHMRTPN